MATTVSGEATHQHWSSGTAFIMAAIGGAVGLGNIWRFPFVVGSNGGSAFVIAYLVAVVVIALPLLMSEMVIGRIGGMSAPNTLRKLSKETGSTSAWIGLGWLCMAMQFLVLSFYSVIAGWTLAYTIKMLTGTFAGEEAGAVAQAFGNFLQQPGTLTLWAGFTMTVTIFIVARGLAGGIEKTIRVLMPTFFVVLLGFVVYALSVGNASKAFEFLFSPDFSKLTPDVVLAAVGQAFYSVTVGTGIMLTYAAYLPKDVPLARSAAIVAGADTLVALIAGLAIFPIVFAYGLDPAEGPGLLFVTLSSAFAQMAWGSLIGGLFFALVFVAAITSCISILEPMVARAEETGKMSRPLASLCIGATIFAFGLLTVLSFNVLADFKPIAGKTPFEIIDYLVSNLMLPLGGLLYALFAGWRLTRESTREALSLNDGLAYSLWRVSTRYLGPLAIAILLVANL